jgi:hypothetical protein
MKNTGLDYGDYFSLEKFIWIGFAQLFAEGNHRLRPTRQKQS